MRRIILHIRLWNEWRKHCLNSKLYKFLVLIGLRQSPSMIGYCIWYGIEIGLKESVDCPFRNFKDEESEEE